MLDRLLQMLAEGGAHSYADLARALGVGEELLQQMIEHLARMGYLKPVGDGCRAKCEDCPISDVCAGVGARQVWGLTDKGSQLARKRH